MSRRSRRSRKSVLAAIRAKQFWIITDGSERPVFETHIDGIFADFPQAS